MPMMSVDTADYATAKDVDPRANAAQLIKEGGVEHAILHGSLEEANKALFDLYISYRGRFGIVDVQIFIDSLASRFGAHDLAERVKRDASSVRSATEEFHQAVALHEQKIARLRGAPVTLPPPSSFSSATTTLDSQVRGLCGDDLQHRLENNMDSFFRSCTLEQCNTLLSRAFLSYRKKFPEADLENFFVNLPCLLFFQEAT